MRFLLILMVFLGTAAFAQKKKKDKDKEPATPPTTQQQQAPAQQTQPQQQQQAQANDTIPSASQILTDHFWRKYQIASRWNDPEVAKSALYDVIVEAPIDSLVYSLAYYYFEEQKFASSLLISQDLLARDPKNQNYLEMAGTSAQQLGVNDKALQHFESLYLINNNIRTLYQIAFLQYQVKRYAECATSIELLLGKPEVMTEKAVFEDPKKQPKEYPLKASVLNLKGLLALDQNDKAGAKKAFTEALAVAPDFVPARTNMEKTK